jgi:hypothetical protein
VLSLLKTKMRHPAKRQASIVRIADKALGLALVILAAAFLLAPNTMSRAPLSRKTLFVGDPNAAGDLTPWDRIRVGETDYKVSDFPHGLATSGTVSVVADPLGAQGQVYKLTATSASNFAASSAISDRVDLWNEPKSYLGQEGQETWEHFQILFSSTGESYKPAPGNWNWLVQHHNNPKYKSFIASGSIERELPELAWGVDTRHKLPNGSLADQLFMVIRGGDDLHPAAETRVYAGTPLDYDRWNDFLIHVFWSHDQQNGLVEWWLNGEPIYSQHIANLWLRPDGLLDHVNFEYSNYRHHADWPSTVYFSRVKIGESRNAVAF